MLSAIICLGCVATHYGSVQTKTQSIHSFACFALLALLVHSIVLHSTHSSARLLTHSRAHGKEVSIYETYASISYSFNPLCIVGVLFIIRHYSVNVVNVRIVLILIRVTIIVFLVRIGFIFFLILVILVLILVIKVFISDTGIGNVIEEAGRSGFVCRPLFTLRSTPKWDNIILPGNKREEVKMSLLLYTNRCASLIHDSWFTVSLVYRREVRLNNV